MRRQRFEAAEADREATWSPGIEERDNPDCYLLIPAGCGRWTHSHANAVGNHLANGLEAGKADPQSQATAGAGGVILIWS